MYPNERDPIGIELNECCANILATRDTSQLNSLQATIEKLILEKQILNRDLLAKCLTQLKGLVPANCLQNLLKKAIELQDKELCHTYLSCVQIVNENAAVDCLQLFISLENKDKNQAIVQTSADLENSLNLIFGLDFDYNFLTKELKRLSSFEFITCLVYLKNLLKLIFLNDNSQIEEELQTSYVYKPPSLIKIADILSCFIDAHFTHITLSTEAQEIIADLSQIIENQVDVFSDIISIESLIKETRSKLNIPQLTRNFGNYQIEVLKF